MSTPDPTAVVPRPKPIGTDLTEIIELGKIFAASGGFPGVTNPAIAIVKILAGRELGFPAVASVKGIHVFDGHIEIGSHLLAAAIRGSGRYDYEILEHTDQVCAIKFTRRMPSGDWKDLAPIVRITLKEAQAKNWHLTRNGKVKDPWEKAPANMLFARCMTNGHKWHCPDLFSGLLVYVEDEMEGTSPPLGVNGLVISHPTTASPQPESPADPQPPPQTSGSLTEEEYAEVVKIGRENGRTRGEVQKICAAMNVPALDRAPRHLQTWLMGAMKTGLVQTAQVDRISALVVSLGLQWGSLSNRLKEKYQQTSVAHLLPHQAQEVEDLLQKELSKRQAAANLQNAVRT